MKIQFPPGLIQFLFDDLNLSREGSCLARHALALFKKSAILLDPIVADCFQ